MAAKKTKTRNRSGGRKRTRRTHKRRDGGGDKSVRVIVNESPTRPLFPVAKIFITDKNKKGFWYNFEDYISSNVYDIEDTLFAHYKNSKGEKLPKKIYIYNGFDINEPFYIPAL